MHSSSHAVAPSGSVALDVPGVEVTRCGGGATTLVAHRAATNRWSASLGPAAGAADLRSRRHDPALPSQLLDELSATAGGDLVQLSIELDLCGAWVTVANAGPCRPVLVRRAGWVDLRGHPGPALGSGVARYADDRVGLGPGDALVLLPGRLRPAPPAPGNGHGHGRTGDDGLLDVLLAGRAVGSALTAGELTGLLGVPDSSEAPAVVLRVPDELGGDRHGYLAAALDVPRDALDLPGYPLGDLQPDLWSRPPIPPRVARLHLPARLAHVSEVRALLTRLLASWRIAERVAAADVALLASEVVTNALRHSGTDATVTVRYTGPSVQVSVRDGSPRLPTVLPPDRSRLGGRGMHLVDTLSAAWGTIRTADGKVVWFEVSVADAPDP